MHEYILPKKKVIGDVIYIKNFINFKKFGINDKLYVLTINLGIKSRIIKNKIIHIISFIILPVIKKFIHIYIIIIEIISNVKSVVETQYLLLFDIISKIIEILSFSELSPDIDFSSNFNSSFSNKVILRLDIIHENTHKTKYKNLKL